jgi:pyridoxine kinase
MAVLSIQSHVVYGYAGNTAAVFPLQRLGREVWAVNTVEFSSHTGYGAVRGKVLGAGLIGEISAGLEERGVFGRCEAILSGYLGDADAGRAIKETVQKVRRAAPGALYCCDPVMGDAGRGFYVKPDIPDIFRDELLPLAGIITPNHFELETLYGAAVPDLAAARKAMELLHARGPGVILVTSFRDMPRADGTPESISMLASDKTGLYRINTPALRTEQNFAGSGDLTTAVFLSRYLETGSVKRTLELTAASVYGILEATIKGGSRELLLIKAQDELVSPSRFFEAEKQ